MRLLKSLLLTLLLAITACGQTTVTFWTANLQHGQGTDNNFNYIRQIDALPGAEVIAVQERGTTDTGWNTGMASAGLVQAVYLENNPTEGDGPAIWYKSSTITISATFTRALTTGTNPSCGSPNVGWDCTTDVRKSAVAVKAAKSGRQFYFVSTHLCWSRCGNSNGNSVSVQRENQASDLVSWISATLTDNIPVIIGGDMNFSPEFAKSTGGLIKDIFTATYTDLWNAGITAGTATTPWGDRDADGIADMTPADIGTQTTGTRTHDTRRIDYFFVKGTGVSLVSISVPDSRATCSVALTANGIFKECPDVAQLWDVTDDQGVRASDHNFIKVVLNLGHVKCRFHDVTRCA